MPYSARFRGFVGAGLAFAGAVAAAVRRTTTFLPHPKCCSPIRHHRGCSQTWRGSLFTRKLLRDHQKPKLFTAKQRTIKTGRPLQNKRRFRAIQINTHATRRHSGSVLVSDQFRRCTRSANIFRWGRGDGARRSECGNTAPSERRRPIGAEGVCAVGREAGSIPARSRQRGDTDATVTRLPG